jgi:hypothetical protein
VCEALRTHGPKILVDPLIQLGLKRVIGWREPKAHAALLEALAVHGLDERQAITAISEDITWVPPIVEGAQDEEPWQLKKWRTSWLRTMATRESHVSASQVLEQAAAEGWHYIALNPSHHQFMVDAMAAVAEAGGVDPDAAQEIVAGAREQVERPDKSPRSNGANRDATDDVVLLGVAKPKVGKERIEPFPYTLAKDIDQNEPKDELIAGFIDADEMAGIFGPMEAGKSNLAVDLTGHIACDLPWCGRKVQSGPVVYFAPERSKVIRRRLKAWMLYHPVTDMPVAVVGCGIDLRTGVIDTKRCIETIRELTQIWGRPPVWAVFDTYACVSAGGDEGSKDTGAVMRNMAIIREHTGVIITPIMHPPVDRDDRPRGHTSLPANMGTTIQVTKRDGGGLRARVMKANDQPDEGRSYHDFRYESVKLYEDEDGNWVTASVNATGPL